MKVTVKLLVLVAITTLVGCSSSRAIQPPRMLDESAWSPQPTSMEIVSHATRSVTRVAQQPTTLHMSPNHHQARSLR
jgi:hypothetical protein